MELHNLESMQKNLEKLKEFYRPYATGESINQLDQKTAIIVASLLSTMNAVNEIATRLQEGDKL